MSENIRVRKSIQALTPLERKSYFWCLKMLSILPPPPGFNYTWTTIVNQTVEAKCIHDLLIAGHNTGCQHKSIYFSHYHRHLCFLSELWLNYVHTILLKGWDALNQKYPAQKYPLLYKETEELWRMVFKEYEEVNFKTVTLHYWNPTNYKEIEDLVVPPELDVKRISQPDVVDKLMKRVRDHYPWEINVKTRMTKPGDKSTPQQLKQILIDPEIEYLSKKPIEDNNKTSLLIKGQYNPRDGSKYSKNHLKQVTKTLENFTQDINQRTAFRNLKLFEQEATTDSSNPPENAGPSQNIHIIGLNQDEMLTTYFSKEKQLHYISKDEKQKNKFSSSDVNSYNMGIHHYSYAQSLFDTEKVPNFYAFIHNSYRVERSHNIMHNNYGYFFRDAANSPTCLLFFPYHSWIDFQIQAKIRMFNNDDKKKRNPTQTNYQSFLSKINTTKNYYSSQSQVQHSSQAIGHKINVSNKRIAEYLRKEFAGFQNSPFFKNKYKDLSLMGAYYIIQWIDPNYTKILKEKPEKDISSKKQILTVACQARDYMVDPSNKQIRTSKNLAQVYRQIYFKNYKSKYESLGTGLDGKNFIDSLIIDYDYQVWDRQLFKQGKLQLLRDDVSNLPKYLIDLKNEFVPTIKKKQVNMESAQKKVNRRKFSQEANFQFSQGTQEEQDYKEILRSQLSTISKELFSQFLTLVVDYPSTTKNGQYSLNLKASNKLKKYFRDLNPSVAERLDNICQESFEIYRIYIFGKEEKAQNCIHCLDKKRQKIELESSLYDSDHVLWKYLHLYALNNGIVALNEDEQNKIAQKQGYQHGHCCVSSKLEVEPIPNFDIKWLLGAEQVSLTFEITNQTKRRPIGSFRIEAHSYSNHTGELKTISRKTSHKLNDQFDFYELHDLSSGSQSSYDNFSYRKVKGSIIINSIERDFEFDIHNYQRKINYVVHLILKEDKIEVSVRDKDYELKKTYYESFEV